MRHSLLSKTFVPNSDAMGFLLQITMSCPRALLRQVAGAGAGCRCWCCELAVHAGAVSWLRRWWRQVAGAGWVPGAVSWPCACVVETGCLVVSVLVLVL